MKFSAPAVSAECFERTKESPSAGAWNFLREVLKNPARIGAVAPTSRRLAADLATQCGVESASKIIELGAGTGVVTREIVEQKSRLARVLAVERNPSFARALERRFPDIEVASCCGSEVAAVAERSGFHDVDSVVCTLPWGNFPPELQRDILTQARVVMSGAGTFGTITCFGWHWLPAARRFEKLLGKTFSSVRVTPVDWRNLPPAFIYTAMDHASDKPLRNDPRV